LGQIEILRGNGAASIKAFGGELEHHRALSRLPELVESPEEAVRGREV